jgi:hypothetical protein
MWNQLCVAKNQIHPICQRVKESREAAGFKTQREMATALGIERDKYKQYEIRTPLPVELWEEFSRLTGAEIYWLATGKHKAPPPVTPEQMRLLRLIEKRWSGKMGALFALLES